MAGTGRGRRHTNTTPTASTAEGALARHWKNLGLDSLESYRDWCRRNGFSDARNKRWQDLRREREHAERLRLAAEAEQEAERHLVALGMRSREEYLTWCERHGFAAEFRKRPLQRRSEQLARQRELGAAAMNSARSLDRRPEDRLRAIASGRVAPDDLKSPTQAAIHSAFGAAGADEALRDAFLSLLIRCSRCPGLLSPASAIGYLGAHVGNTYVRGLLALAGRAADWIRDPGLWQPESHSARRQFGSLARHLLCRFETPSFLDSAWLEGDRPQARSHQDWFIHIGSGQNIRTADLGIEITRRAAHLFLQAPRELPIESALRWAQVQALGGDEPLARTLLTTRLAELQTDEEFWRSVIFFFINNPMLHSSRIVSIVDFVHQRRFVPAELLDPDGRVIGVAVPEPDFSMKGRTGLALSARVDAWHRALNRDTKRPPVKWSPSGIASYADTERDPASGIRVTWTIDEILTSKGLQEEGRIMRHCVASYAPACVRGAASIWTVQIREGADANRRRVMTIEVDNARRTVVQARGRCNKTPGDKRAGLRLALAPAVIRRWAEQQGLTIPSHICL